MNNKKNWTLEEQEWGTEAHRAVITKRLEEIDNKDIKCLEKRAEEWGKTLIDKELLNNLKDFDFWKEWKNKK